GSVKVVERSVIGPPIVLPVPPESAASVSRVAVNERLGPERTLPLTSRWPPATMLTAPPSAFDEPASMVAPSSIVAAPVTVAAIAPPEELEELGAALET